MKILSIDVGLIKPGFSIIDVEDNNVSIKIFNGISFKNLSEVPLILDYFLSNNIISKVLIERQHSEKNKNVMYFFQGYFAAKQIEVVIRSPIGYIRPDKKDKRRSTIKGFSVDSLNDIFKRNDINFKLLKKNCDDADAINMALLYIHESESKDNNGKNYIQGFSKHITEVRIIHIRKE